ncbi:hypothetical protein AAL_03675 [Moelleriella libera RCEF 2490]|uniref:Phosphatidylglycerol lysyltransferase C-terminal domain-containing protein n=1 Tax=Moelleriella libera RCEF 2490 TaxID=1081109 RepID=A0A168DG67_9HYPO|nr:hypothetical protein AAL_03675 [Moelleriella libera RCEF 2490]
MNSEMSFHSELPSLWTKNPACLIERLARAAERELAGGHHNATRSAKSPTTLSPSRSSSRRESQEGRSLCDTLVISAEEQILDESYDKYSRTFHMVLLDPNYKIFTSPKGYGSIIYKTAKHTLVVVGDPLCSTEDMHAILEELRQFRRSRKLRLAFMGVSDAFLQYAKQQRWASFEFGCERVINPMNNDVLNKKAGKRMLSQNRQLLDPKKGGLKMHLYAPSITGIDLRLERQLEQLYGDWCGTKHDKGLRNKQAFITAYDIFSQRSKTAFLYTTRGAPTSAEGGDGHDDNGGVCGMAMLRQLGVNAGFHIDPCIASADAPRGTTDLLMVTAMRMLQRADISYLSLGAEPLATLQQQQQKGQQATPVRQMHLSDRLADMAYRKVTNHKAVAGKKVYNDKFHPDPALESSLHVVFPKTLFPVQEALAIMRIAHVRRKHMFD